MHRAKGMEFECVLIFGGDADLIPAAYLMKSVPDRDSADLLQREQRSLFYVAATRARNQLFVTWAGNPQAAAAVTKSTQGAGEWTSRPQVSDSPGVRSNPD
jgi:superfamily I DNA/RNA helicase